MALAKCLAMALALGVLAPAALAGSFGAPPPDIRDRLDALVAAYPYDQQCAEDNAA